MSFLEDFRWRQIQRRMTRLEGSNAEAHQRLARVFMPGKVAQIRPAGDDWQIRLDLGESADEGKPVLSPWLAVQPVSAGALKVKVKPAIGERFAMLSPSGTVGTGSWAVRGPFDQDHAAPEGAEDVVVERGETRIGIEDGRVLITTGEATVELAGGDVKINGEIALSGDGLTHNSKNVGDTHIHGGVLGGPATTGVPED